MDELKRPLVVVEDHIAHIDQILDLLRQQGPDLLERLAVVCLERPGPDTADAAARWRQAYPEVEIVADADLPGAIFESSAQFHLLVAGFLAPRGLLVWDIQLQTLRFVPADHWWESIGQANAIRGMFVPRPPKVLFMSNKRGFHATFGKDLTEFGFDPCDVLNKDELGETLVPTLRQKLHEAFPLELELEDCDRWLTLDLEEHEELCAEMDLILWEERAATLVLSGRIICADRLELSASSHEAQTWRALVDAHLAGLPGVSTTEVGQRVAPEFAEPAECGNLAARHIFGLRKRLVDRTALQTVDHHYRLAEELRVGRVGGRAR